MQAWLGPASYHISQVQLQVATVLCAAGEAVERGEGLAVVGALPKERV